MVRHQTRQNIVLAAVLNTKKPLVITDIFRMEKNSNTDEVWLVSVCLWGWKFRAQFSWHQHIKSEFSQNISVLKRNLFSFSQLLSSHTFANPVSPFKWKLWKLKNRKVLLYKCNFYAISIFLTSMWSWNRRKWRNLYFLSVSFSAAYSALGSEWQCTS